MFWDYYDQLVFITSNYNLYKYYNKFKGCAQYFSELTQDQKYIDFNVPDLNINITFLGFRDPATFVGTAFLSKLFLTFEHHCNWEWSYILHI